MTSVKVVLFGLYHMMASFAAAKICENILDYDIFYAQSRSQPSKIL